MNIGALRPAAVGHASGRRGLRPLLRSFGRTQILRGLLAKVVHVVLVLLIVSFAVTFMLDLAPGDPAFSIYGEYATPEQIERVHADLRLDDPIYERYFAWVADAARGDLGVSYHTGRTVAGAITQHIGPTLELMAAAVLAAIIISVPLGVYTAYRRDGWVDRAVSVLTSGLIATPPFVSAVLLVFISSIQLQGTPFGFPSTGWVPFGENPAEHLRHLFLPALALALTEIPNYTRVLRADMIATLNEDFILAARAKGISTMRVLLHHALQPSSLSLVTLAGLSVARLIGGAVIVETLFAVPGIGSLLVTSVDTNDATVVQGIVLFSAVIFVLVNAVVDVSYRRLDPRVRLR